MVKNTTFQPGRSWGEVDLVTQKHQNMHKVGCFWPFSHFSCFWDALFSHFPKNPNFVHQMLDKISQMIWIGHFWTQKWTLNFDQKQNRPVSNARCPPLNGKFLRLGFLKSSLTSWFFHYFHSSQLARNHWVHRRSFSAGLVPLPFPAHLWKQWICLHLFHTLMQLISGHTQDKTSQDTEFDLGELS